MTRPPESTHERLNRELARMNMRDIGFWGGWALLIGVVGLFAFLSLNHVTNVRYVTAIAGETTLFLTEDGASIKTSVTVEGHTRIITLPSQLVHPAKGETICLRAGEHRFTGHTSYVIVSRTLCDAPSATQEVE